MLTYVTRMGHHQTSRFRNPDGLLSNKRPNPNKRAWRLFDPEQSVGM